MQVCEKEQFTDNQHNQPNISSRNWSNEVRSVFWQNLNDVTFVTFSMS